MTVARSSVAVLAVTLALVGSALTGCTTDRVAPPDAGPDETSVSIEATGLVSNELADHVGGLVAEGWELRTDEPSVDGGRRAGLVGAAGDAEGCSITVIGGPDDSPLRSVDFQVNGPVVSTT